MIRFKPKLLSVLALTCLGLVAQAASIHTVTITVTNVPANGDTLIINLNTRTWTNAVTSPATQILIGSDVSASATNMFRQLAAYPVLGITPQRVSTNAMRIFSLPDQNLGVEEDGFWAVLTTSDISDAPGYAVRVPMASQEPVATQRTNISSLLVTDLSTYPSNSFPETAPLLRNHVNLSQPQTVKSKTLENWTLRGTNALGTNMTKVAVGTNGFPELLDAAGNAADTNAVQAELDKMVMNGAMVRRVVGNNLGANPTALVGPVAVPGTSNTFQRSDAAPAIDLTATYPWTGHHSFSRSGSVGDVTLDASGSDTNLHTFQLKFTARTTNQIAAVMGIIAALKSQVWTADTNTWNADIEIQPAAAGTPAPNAAFKSDGSVVLGPKHRLVTNSVTGFLYVPSMQGTPTGFPTDEGGYAVPVVVDTTNDRFYFFSNGAWHQGGGGGGGGSFGPFDELDTQVIIVTNWVSVGSYVSLSSTTNRLTDDGTHLLRNGVRVGTVNPTDTYLPVRISDTEFGDSPWYVPSGGVVALDGFRSGSDFSRLSIAHQGTNGPVAFNSEAQGIAGHARYFSFQTNGVEILSIGNGSASLILLDPSSAYRTLVADHGYIVQNGQVGTNLPFTATFQQGIIVNESGTLGFTNTPVCSPAIGWQTVGWDTNTASLHQVNWASYVVPSPETNQPTSVWKLTEFNDNFTSTELLSVSSEGPTRVARITKAQKTAIIHPADGMIVYQTDNTPGFRVYVNGSWFILNTSADP